MDGSENTINYIEELLASAPERTAASIERYNLVHCYLTCKYDNSQAQPFRKELLCRQLQDIAELYAKDSTPENLFFMLVDSKFETFEDLAYSIMKQGKEPISEEVDDLLGKMPKGFRAENWAVPELGYLLLTDVVARVAECSAKADKESLDALRERVENATAATIREHNFGLFLSDYERKGRVFRANLLSKSLQDISAACSMPAEQSFYAQIAGIYKTFNDLFYSACTGDLRTICIPELKSLISQKTFDIPEFAYALAQGYSQIKEGCVRSEGISSEMLLALGGLTDRF